MRNILFVLFIFLNFFCITKCNHSVVNDIHYYVYMIRDINVIVCSDIERKNLNFSKVEIMRNKNDGFECLINLHLEGIFKLNFTMSSVDYNQETRQYEVLDEQTTRNIFKRLNIKIGLNDIQEHRKDHKPAANSIQLILKFLNGHLSFTTESSCNKYSEDENTCNFVRIDDAITNSKYLKLDFDFLSSYRQFNLILLDQQENNLSNECNTACVNGICSQGTCYCKNGYMGDNCESCKILK